MAKKASFRFLDHCLAARMSCHPTKLFLGFMLGEGKYGPGFGPQWKTGGTRYPNLYKAILEEPSRIRRTKLLEDNLRGTVSYGRITRRPTRARIRNQ